MTVGELNGVISARLITESGHQREIRGAFMSDVMSLAMSNGFAGMAWITHRADMNALAIAVMKGAACIISPGGIGPEEDVIRRAETENMPLILSERPAFELAGLLYEAGLRGEESV